MDKQETEKPFRVVGYKITPLGARATMLYHYNGNELHRDEVRLWKDDSRKAFITRCLQARGEDLTTKQQEELRRQWDEDLRKIEIAIKVKNMQTTQQGAASNNGKCKEPTDQEKLGALAVLKHPSLLFELGKLFRVLGIAGEKINALILYLALTSRFLQKIISVAIKSESSAGKSNLVEKVLKVLPPESYVFVSGMSKQALIYDDQDFKHKMIIIAEAGGGEAASLNIRTLLSENRLVFRTVEKDPATGRQGTREVSKEGPTGLITTTTLPRLHPENETRLVSLAIDESESQTDAVKRAIAAEYAQGWVEPDTSVWVNAQRLLRPVRVIISYANYLAEHTPKTPLRIRRDFGKLMTFISTSAALHQYQRKQTTDGTVIANLADYFYAKVLLEKVFFGSLYNIHPNTEKVMEAIKYLWSKKKPNEAIGTRNLMDHLDWTKSKVLRWAKPLHDFDWVLKEWPDTQDFCYRPGKEPKPSNSSLPLVEELAEEFPELAKDFSAFHPLSGDEIKLQKEEPTGAYHSVS